MNAQKCKRDKSMITCNTVDQFLNVWAPLWRTILVTNYMTWDKHRCGEMRWISTSWKGSVGIIMVEALIKPQTIAIRSYILCFHTIYNILTTQNFSSVKYISWCTCMMFVPMPHEIPKKPHQIVSGRGTYQSLKVSLKERNILKASLWRTYLKSLTKR